MNDLNTKYLVVVYVNSEILSVQEILNEKTCGLSNISNDGVVSECPNEINFSLLSLWIFKPLTVPWF